MKYVTYGVREFQQHFGEAMRAAQNGDRVIITSHGRSVVALVKANGKLPNETRVERRLRRLAAQGKIILGTGGPVKDFPVFHEGGLVRQLLKDREERERILMGDRPKRGRKRR